ncbi:hypothetical protein Y1Q_0022233 [Alligator mississippiensis]|uniref:Uncharacterized protein n=1 Tax=Alligator mississippiensis TaxID=8496 RepID=A0A151P047_ALLMI|nr:hypothetical protein Y1Q_0022233 [Alligator mississippiensis]
MGVVGHNGEPLTCCFRSKPGVGSEKRHEKSFPHNIPSKKQCIRMNIKPFGVGAWSSLTCWRHHILTLILRQGPECSSF